VNAGFVKRHGKCGKCRLRRNKRFPHAVWFGATGSARFFRAYPKPEIQGFRLEHQANRAFLEQYGIETPADYPRLAEVLIQQIGFYRMNWTELSRFVRRHLRHPDAILRMARRRAGILIELLTFLRSISIANPDRFLLPMAINGRISEALKQWAEQWNRDAEKRPTRKS
jgi:hypothetical protein